jgi:hypothetical protein
MTDAELLYAVQQIAAGEYEVLGEIGRTAGGPIVFLARDLATAAMVAMRLDPSGKDDAGVPQFSLDVLHELDESVPSLETTCPRCAKPLRKWARFCTKCGLDVSGVSPSLSGASMSRDVLRKEAERVAAASGYDLLGEMPRAAGGGDVYFARDRQTNRIFALRLMKESGQSFELGVTGMMKPVDMPTAKPATGTVGIVAGKNVRTSSTHRVPDAVPAPDRPAVASTGIASRRVLVLAVTAVVLTLALVAYSVFGRR